MDTRIIYIRGLWSHDIATAWIKNKLEDYISIPVELFDYHDILVDNIDTGTYLSRVVEKFCDLYPFSNGNFIIIGHSHGGALATILVERLNIDKTVLINPVACFLSALYNLFFQKHTSFTVLSTTTAE